MPCASPSTRTGEDEGRPSLPLPIQLADVAGRLAGRDDVRRLRELADELTADQRLVLACQVALDMDCQGSSGERWACRCQCRAPRSLVASERLGLEPSAFGAILEDVGDADCGSTRSTRLSTSLRLGLSPKPRSFSRAASALATSPGVGLLSG